MQLILQELGISAPFDELVQTITAPSDRDLTVTAIRPHLYKHNAPSGNLKLQILDSTATTVIAESEEILITDISAANYFHGYVRFYIDARLAKGTDYVCRLLSTGGYSFSESDYIGLCLDYDLAKYAKSYTPGNNYETAYDLEIWEKKDVRKGEI